MAIDERAKALLYELRGQFGQLKRTLTYESTESTLKQNGFAYEIVATIPDYNEVSELIIIKYTNHDGQIRYAAEYGIPMQPDDYRNIVRIFDRQPSVDDLIMLDTADRVEADILLNGPVFACTCGGYHHIANLPGSAADKIRAYVRQSCYVIQR